MCFITSPSSAFKELLNKPTLNLALYIYTLGIRIFRETDSMNKKQSNQEKWCNYKRNIVLYTISLFGKRGVERTRIMKILFLVDLELRRRYGISLFRWIMWKYGPFSKEVLDILDDLELSNDTRVKRSSKYVIYIRESNVDLNDELLKDIINDIVHKFKDMDLKELLEYVYNLPEVKSKLPGQNIW